MSETSDDAGRIEPARSNEEELDQGDRLLQIALRISDHAPVDWSRTGDADPRRTKSLGGLRAIEAVAREHRRSANDGATPATGELDGAPAAPLFTWGTLQGVEKIGDGAFGEVWRAWDPALQRHVALKLRLADEDDRGARRWLDEARRLARIRHPNVLTVYGADRRDGKAGIWTDLVVGRTLEELIETVGPLGAHEAASIGIDLCAALAAVHASGLVHGDVKATNVMREGAPSVSNAGAAAGRIVLMDFGSAHESAGGRAPISGGTPLYSAPEVIDGAAPTVASDLYALGVLLYRLVSGVYPFTAPDRETLRKKLASSERRALRDIRPDLPSAFVQTIERALDSNPAQRFASAAEMEQALSRTAGAKHDAHVSNRGSRPVMPLAFAIGIAALIIIIIAFGLTMRTKNSNVPDHIAKPKLDGPAAARLAQSSDEMPAAPSAPNTGVAPSDAGAYSVAARFYRGASQRDQLRYGERVAPGDSLSLVFEASESVFVYVVNEDTRGEAFLLFPVPGLSPANPLAPGVQHVLPGRLGTRPYYWRVTSAGEVEHFLIVASRRSLAGFEREIAALEPASGERAVEYPTLSADRVLDELRGVGGLAAENSTESGEGSPAEARAAARRLFEIADPLRDERESVTGVWVRRLDLINPSTASGGR